MGNLKFRFDLKYKHITDEGAGFGLLHNILILVCLAYLLHVDTLLNSNEKRFIIFFGSCRFIYFRERP